MTHCTFLLLLSIISVSHLMRQVAALKAEGIANGKIVNQTDFKYQVAIYARSKYDGKNEFRCNGVILSAHWILGVAHCFMMTSEMIQWLIFTAVAGSGKLSAANSISSMILFIYTHLYGHDKYFSNVAMARSNNSMISRGRSDRIAPAKIGDKRLFENEAVVSGYGSSKVTPAVNCHGQDFFVKANPDLKLRSASVEIKGPTTCSSNFPRISLDKRFCGKAKPFEGKYTGVCANDAGSPLVIRNKLIGLASESYVTCDDTVAGSLYINVTAHGEFIKSILHYKPLKDAVKHFTRKH